MKASTWLARRTTGDILLLLIAGTICGSVILGGATVALVEILHPSTDTSTVIGMIGDVINTLIGLLAGFLAGRTDAIQVRREVEHAVDEAKTGD